VLSLDADDRISPALRDEVLAAIRSGRAEGYCIPRLSESCAIFHGGLAAGRHASASAT